LGDNLGEEPRKVAYLREFGRNKTKKFTTELKLKDEKNIIIALCSSTAINWIFAIPCSISMKD